MNESVRVAPAYDGFPIDFPALIRLFVIGIVTGALGWLLYLAISNYFIVPVFCRSADAFAVCSNGGTIAWLSGHIIALFVAVAVAARAAVYRPLLIAIAVLATLWSAHAWLGVLPWYMGLLWQMALFGIAFAAYGWLARAANFMVVLIVTLALIVLSRLVLLWA